MSTPPTERCRLYLITPPAIANLARFADELRAAFAGGDVASLQLRLKGASDDEILRAAETLLPVARTADVYFILNDRPDLAKRAGADGVHIGQEDASYAEARAIMGAEAAIGVTCHNSMHLAIEAGEAGADYVAFGAFFPTRTKDAKTRADIDLLRNWSIGTTVPSVAIGGINAENCGRLVAAGADFIAVSAAIWENAEGPEKAVTAINKAIDEALEDQSH
ncbi:MAG: thiamine phosphate synthase [Parvularculaceae bacterium]